MTTNATVRTLSAEEIAASAAGETAFLLLPERATVFAERAMRLRQLAQGHHLHDYLVFLAAVALEQDQALQVFASVVLPDTAALGQAARRGEPPLPASDWPRDPAWRDGLHAMAQRLLPGTAGAVRTALERILQGDADFLEQQADCLLSGDMVGLDLACAPVIAAALQVYWTHMVLQVQRLFPPPLQTFGRTADATVCPCCGSLPVASVTQAAGSTPGQRYLVCSLCSARWNMVRIQCSHCLGTEGITYQSLDLADAPVPPQESLAEGTSSAHRAAIQAEACERCGHYLKIMHAERDAAIDPVADDIASLTLDLLVSQEGLQRHGVNLMLLFGDGTQPNQAAGP
ncbi:MAG: formate dehydrogenase accessory protein FdhE [Burkholderiales bacterium]